MVVLNFTISIFSISALGIERPGNAGRFGGSHISFYLSGGQAVVIDVRLDGLCIPKDRLLDSLTEGPNRRPTEEMMGFILG